MELAGPRAGPHRGDSSLSATGHRTCIMSQPHSCPCPWNSLYGRENRDGAGTACLGPPAPIKVWARMPSYQVGQGGGAEDRRAQGQAVPEEDVASQGLIGSEAEGAQASRCEPQQGQGGVARWGHGQ